MLLILNIVAYSIVTNYLLQIDFVVAYHLGSFLPKCNNKFFKIQYVAHTSQLSGLGRSVWQQDEFG